MGAAIAFLVVFAILSIGHLGILIRSRIWWTSVLVVGGVAEIIGWVGRLWSSINVGSLNAFLTQEIW